MTTDRPYQKAMKFEDALARIESFVGTRYDARVVAAFSEACNEGQIRPGSVRLKKPVPVVPKPELVGHVQETGPAVAG
jgi:HD-GYP domain-containing protein (c-di-GMP phosphodiesterase class II)